MVAFCFYVYAGLKSTKFDVEHMSRTDNPIGSDTASEMHVTFYLIFLDFNVIM